MKKRTIVIIILDVLMITFYFLAYGPISYFRELLITTAMATKEHKYLARTLYSEKTIAVPIPNSKMDIIPMMSENNEFTLNNSSPNWFKKTFLTMNNGTIEIK